MWKRIHLYIGGIHRLRRVQNSHFPVSHLLVTTNAVDEYLSPFLIKWCTTFRRRKGVSFYRYVLGVEEGGESFKPASSQLGFQISDGSIGFGQPRHTQERCQRSIDPLIRPSTFPRNYENVAVLRERVCRELGCRPVSLLVSHGVVHLCRPKRPGLV